MDNIERTKDLILIKKAQQGDRESFDILINKYYNNLMMTANKMLRNKHNAEDAVQNAIIYAWKSIKRFKFTEKGTALGWLNTLVTGKSIDLIRNITGKSQPIYADLDGENVLYADESLDPSKIAYSNELKNSIRAMMFNVIGEMTPIRKTTAFLYFILNESPQQIADKLQVNIKTIQKRIERTKHQLKSRLIKKYGDHELIKELL